FDADSRYAPDFFNDSCEHNQHRHGLARIITDIKIMNIPALSVSIRENPWPKLWILIQIRVPQISFHRKILAETVQAEPLQVCSFTHAAKTWAGCERHSSSPRKDLRRVVQEHLVDNARGQRRPIYQRTAFDHYTCDFSRCKSLTDRLQIRTPVESRSCNLFHLNPVFQKLLSLLLFGE